MAETSAILFSTFSSRLIISPVWISRSAARFSSFYPRSRPSRFAVKASHYGIEWIREERITLFTSDGLIQIGGNMVPRRINPSHKKHGRSKSQNKHQKFQESAYMDPAQGLCLGALFDIAATNVVATEKESKSGLQEKLTMTVAVPYLWGVLPAAESLHLAVRTGGGIVDKIYRQWHFL